MNGEERLSDEKIRRFVGRFLEVVPHLRVLGVGFSAMGPDWAELLLPWSADLVAYPETGVIASGAVFSLMDSAAGMSVVVARGRFEPYATLDLRCDYLRPARPGQAIFGRAQCYHVTRRMAFVRGTAHDGDEAHPLAHVSGTFMFTAVP